MVGPHSSPQAGGQDSPIPERQGQPYADGAIERRQSRWRTHRVTSKAKFVQPTDERLELAGRIVTVLGMVFRIATYATLVVICNRYHSVYHFVTGFFLADLIAHVYRMVRFFAETTTRDVVELAGYGVLLVLMIAMGDVIPNERAEVGMVFLSFLCFCILRVILLGWRHGVPSVLSKVYRNH